MSRGQIRPGIAIVLSAAIVSSVGVVLAASRFVYPIAPRDNTVDTYYGVHVPDPYRPLENLDAPRTRAWLAAEKSLTTRYFAQVPQRTRIAAHLLHIADYPTYALPSHYNDMPFHFGDQYMYTYNSGHQNQFVLYTMHGPRGTPHVLLDPNRLSPDGSISLAAWSVTNDGKFIAYATMHSGSDWETWRVRNIATGADLPDVIEWSQFSVAAWVGDRGFYYERFAQPRLAEKYRAVVIDEQVYYHRLGTPQSSDTLIYADPKHSNYFFHTEVSQDGRYLILTQTTGASVNNRLYYEDLHSSHPRLIGLFTKNDASYDFIDDEGSRFFIETDRDAPNSRIVAVDLTRPAILHDVVPQSNDAIQDATSAGNRFFVQYLHDVHTVVSEYTYAGTLVRQVALPGVGIASGFDGWHSDRMTYYDFTNYTTPSEIYALNIAAGTSTLYHRPAVNINLDDFVTREVFYRSKDGTLVPLFISYRKWLQKNGENPTILYSYGGFGISMLPTFSPMNIAWLQMGGIYAVANIRGGSEYGERWHVAGMLSRKQNVFNDFVAAAQYLIASRYTSSRRLAINGVSNGGLLVGAVEVQRPDLFGAALANVGVMDMLRYQFFTVGNAWIPEYGCSTCSKAQFETLYAYSPYHNIRPNTTYPPTLVTTADHDDRVFPAHSFKFVARMQADQAGPAPILLRVDTQSGHAGKALDKIIGDYTDEFAFLVRNFGMSLPPNY